MAGNNPKKFWKRKDGKLILNPLNRNHLIKCSTNPCGDYWAIFGKRSYGTQRYYDYSNQAWYYPFSYEVGIYFVSDGKAQWIEREWNEDQGEYVDVAKCASIDVNGRPNGLQKVITIYTYQVQITSGDQIYDQENDEWIYVQPTYQTRTQQREFITEWYRLSKPYANESEAIQAFFYPCNIQAPFPSLDSTQARQCINDYWKPKTIQVSSPLFKWRSERMRATYMIYPYGDKMNVQDYTYTYQYNPDNKEICESSSSGCITGSLACKEFSSWPEWTKCACAYIELKDGIMYDYMTAGETDFSYEDDRGCKAANTAFEAMSSIIAPHVYKMMTNKNTFFASYYCGNSTTQENTIVWNNGQYTGPYYDTSKFLFHKLRYEVKRGVQNDHKGSTWYRFVYKRTQQTPSEAVGLKIEITIKDIKTIVYNSSSSSSSEATSSFTTDIYYDKYYEDLPIPSYFDIFNLKKGYTCITQYAYDQQTGELVWIRDECDNENNGCTIVYEPGTWYAPYNDKSQKYEVSIKVIDIIFPSDFIKSGYAMPGEKDYDGN